ncbi:MAG: 4Fe-4S binding protein [Pseudomonadota bacterium]
MDKSITTMPAGHSENQPSVPQEFQQWKYQDNFVQSVLSWIMKSGKRLKPFQAVLYIFRLGKIPGLRLLIPWLNPKKNSFTYLPVNQSLKSGTNTVLPAQIIHDFIEEATIHVIMDQCGCRILSDCKNHTHDVGCLFMGETALKLPHAVSRRVDRQQAHEHVEKAISNGLIPMSGKVRIDNFIYMTPDRKKLLSVCFCCPCCCILRSYKHLPGIYLDGIIEPIAGLSVRVSDRCVGCGTCLSTCPFDAIRIIDGRAVHSANCRGCGRCETNCPQGAVEIKIENQAYAEKIKDRIHSYVQF